MNQELYLKERLKNSLHSLLLVGTMASVPALLAGLMGGELLFAYTLLLMVLFYLFTPGLSPERIMAWTGSRSLSPREAPRLFRLLRELARRANLTTLPALYYLPQEGMNAFTVGSPERSAIALSEGLLHRLNSREIAGVLAHEVSHIGHKDLQSLAFAQGIHRLTHHFALIGQFLLLVNLPLLFIGSHGAPWTTVLFLIFAPTLSGLLLLALSRTREYEADLGAARLTDDPRGLASALAHIDHYQRRRRGWFFFPRTGREEDSLFQTHPPTRERINRLMQVREGASHGSRPAVRVYPSPPLPPFF